MLANDWTALLARELMAELRQGERQRVGATSWRQDAARLAAAPAMARLEALRQGGEQT